MALTTCRACKNHIAKNAVRCPKCGHRRTRWLGAALTGVFLFFFAIYGLPTIAVLLGY